MITLFVLLGVLFLISPVLGVATSFLMLCFYYKSRKKIMVIFIYLSLFLGLVNILKVPENDIIHYLETYSLVNNYDFLTYITQTNKEPLFYIFNYLVFQLTGGSHELYILILTFVCYNLLFVSIWKVHKKINYSPYAFLLAIGVTFLFPTLFSLSAHLLRQFFAASLLFYVLIEIIFYNKKRVVLFFLSVLIHTSTLFFSILYLPILNKKVNLIRVFLISIISLVIINLLFYYSGVLVPVFKDVPLISYALDRIARPDLHVKFEKLGIFVFLFHFLVITIFYFYSIKKETNYLLDIKKHKLFNTSLILFLFIILNYNNTEMAIRFSVFMYFLLPLSFYFIFNLFDKKTNRVLNIYLTFPVLLIFMAWFVYKLNYGVWTYSDLISLF